MAKNGYERPNDSYLVYDLSCEEHFEQVNVNTMLNLGLYLEMDLRKSKGQEISEEWLNRDWYGAPVFLTGQQIPNKQAHKVFKVQGDASISIDAPDGYLQRRYAEPLKEKYPDRKERDNVESDFHLTIGVEPAEISIALSQSRINKEIPEGLTGYDARVVEIDKLKK